MMTQQQKKEINEKIMNDLDGLHTKKKWYQIANSVDGTRREIIGTLDSAVRECLLCEQFDGVQWRIINVEPIDICHVCGREERLEVLEHIGECLNCDHIRSESVHTSLPF